MPIQKPSIQIDLGQYRNEEEARFAHNLAVTIIANSEGRNPRPDEMYRLEKHEVPDSRRIDEIWDEVFHRLAAITAHQRN